MSRIDEDRLETLRNFEFFMHAVGDASENDKIVAAILCSALYFRDSMVDLERGIRDSIDNINK